MNVSEVKKRKKIQTFLKCSEKLREKLK